MKGQNQDRLVKRSSRGTYITPFAIHATAVTLSEHLWEMEFHVLKPMRNNIFTIIIVQR